MMRGYGPWSGAPGARAGFAAHGFFPGAGLLGGLFVLAVVVGIVVLIVLLVRHKPGGVHPVAMAPAAAPIAAPVPPARFADALEVAAKRYASGEITKEQYEEMCRTLGVRPGAPSA